MKKIIAKILVVILICSTNINTSVDIQADETGYIENLSVTNAQVRGLSDYMAIYFTLTANVEDVGIKVKTQTKEYDILWESEGNIPVSGSEPFLGISYYAGGIYLSDYDNECGAYDITVYIKDKYGCIAEKGVRAYAYPERIRSIYYAKGDKGVCFFMYYNDNYVDTYTLYRRTENTEMEKVAEIDGGYNYYDTDIKAGVTYYYTIAANKYVRESDGSVTKLDSLENSSRGNIEIEILLNNASDVDYGSEEETSTEVDPQGTEKVTNAQTTVNPQTTTGGSTPNSVTKPRKVKLSKVKNVKSKKVRVLWEKLTDVNGYQIQYALNKKFTKSKKTISATGANKTIKKLKKKKTYYFRVRAYKNSNRGKVYGAWSNVKKVKIKK